MRNVHFSRHPNLHELKLKRPLARSDDYAEEEEEEGVTLVHGSDQLGEDSTLGLDNVCGRNLEAEYEI